MTEIADARLYVLGCSIEELDPNVDQDEWEARFRAALDAEVGYSVSEAEFVRTCARLKHVIEERRGRSAARRKIQAVADRVQPLLAEYTALVQTLDDAAGSHGDAPIAAINHGRIVALFEPLSGIDLRRFEELLAQLLGASSEIERLAAPYPGIVTREIANWPTMRAMHAALVEMRSDEDRHARIVARAEARPPDATPTAVRCSDCGKKAARIGPRCKRCARAAGLLPHGKIGEEL